MMGIYEARSASPMLIAQQTEAFDDPDWIYELKMDGFRCLAYIDRNSVDFRNKRNIQMLPKFPELAEIYKNVNGRCIGWGNRSACRRCAGFLPSSKTHSAD